MKHLLVLFADFASLGGLLLFCHGYNHRSSLSRMLCHKYVWRFLLFVEVKNFVGGAMGHERTANFMPTYPRPNATIVSLKRGHPASETLFYKFHHRFSLKMRLLQFSSLVCYVGLLILLLPDSVFERQPTNGSQHCIAVTFSRNAMKGFLKCQRLRYATLHDSFSSCFCFSYYQVQAGQCRPTGSPHFSKDGQRSGPGGALPVERCQQ